MSSKNYCYYYDKQKLLNPKNVNIKKRFFEKNLKKKI